MGIEYSYHVCHCYYVTVTMSLFLCSQNMNTCPVDRQKFNVIKVHLHANGKCVKEVSIIKRIIIYHIVGFFEVLKFCEFRGFSGFVKFKPSKKLTQTIYCRAFGLIALDHMSFSGW